MDTPSPPIDPHATASQVRAGAGSAAIAAALLIYFGFVHLLEPTGSDLFSRAAWVFFHTLRIGGVAMAVVAMLALTGHPIVLILDAVVSVAIGLLLPLTGVAMLIDGGGMMQPLINVICGAFFLSAGVRNGRHYFLLTRSCHGRAKAEWAPPLAAAAPPQASAMASPQESPAAGIEVPSTRFEPAPSPEEAAPHDAQTLRDDSSESRDGFRDTQDETSGPPENAVDSPPGSPDGVQDPSPPPPDGFLASFGRKGPPPGSG